MRSLLVIRLEPTEHAALAHLVRAPTTRNGMAQRARIILSLAAGVSITQTARLVGVPRRIVRGWGPRFRQHRLPGLADRPRPVAHRSFPPTVAVHLVKLACERPATLGRSLSPWDCRELARPLERDGMVAHMSSETVRRLLVHHQLTPWRHHRWLSPHTPRDAECSARVSDVVSLYTRRLRTHEMVLCVDEKTSVPPRPRVHAIRPALPGRPNQVEHEYRRDGALNLLARFDTRTGRVDGPCDARQRPRECIAFLESLHAAMPVKITTIHLSCDNARSHHGTQVHEWLQSPPRFVLHFTPVHGSWRNQMEPWVSILQRKRLRIVDFASQADLQAKLMQFIAAWHEVAHPFNWTTKSVANVMADAVPAAA
ncbi:MAG: IS630 family transposase [Candidatus Entotheonellia bacterium]